MGAQALVGGLILWRRLELPMATGWGNTLIEVVTVIES